ncbi:MAG: DEAD/DEAH box helicase [Halobacteria archaeon]
MRTENLAETYPDYSGQIEHREVLREREPETVDAENVLPSGIADALGHDLYLHQRDALDYLKEGRDVCISTSTSSGKTLIYALGFARRYLRDTDSCGLAVYPTKALSRDQLKELREVYDRLNLPIEVGVYDGDVSPDEKRRVRDNCDLILTNFAGLNHYLPHHSRWSRILGNLELLVIDESHFYSGVQGMHAAWIVRRLLRIVESTRYGADPDVVLTSATVGNPGEHGQSLTGRDVAVVDRDSSPRGRRELVFWNPPEYVNDMGVKARRSTHRESSEVLAHLTHYGRQSLMFAPSRKTSELDARWTEERLREEYRDTDTEVEPYHAGLRDVRRREIEKGLKSGDVDGVVSTTALEVGINVGGIDATLLSGYPGSKVGFWQQVGRSGRRSRDALSVLVAQNDSINQYIVRNPSYLFEGDVEDAVVDVDNNHVFTDHMLAAAREQPLTLDDTEFFGERLESVVEMYRRSGEFEGDLGSGVHYVGSGRPEADIDVYAAGGDRFDVLVDRGDDTESLPSVGRSRAYRDLHPGAVYLHEGRYYVVKEFRDDTDPRVVLEECDADYYTETLRDVELRDLNEEGSRKVGRCRLRWGYGRVLEHYPSYRKKRISNDEVIDTVPTGLEEPVELYTQLVWLEIPTDLEESIDSRYEKPDAFLGGVHALEHGLINMSPLELLVDSADLGGLSTRHHPETEDPSLFVYDGVEGGLGFSRKIYEKYEDLSRRTKGLIESCDCEVRGCPGCVMDYMCGDDNEPLHTDAALDVAEAVLAEGDGGNKR